MRETALVTGASSGIGEQFARQLAARGHDLVLVARRADRLERLAAELPTEAQVVPCDLATEPARCRSGSPSSEWRSSLLGQQRRLRHLGPVPAARPGARRRAGPGQLRGDRHPLTHAFLPAMVERGRGGIINVASTAGMQPIPYESVYAATKAFAISFTDALHTELRGSGVRVLAVNPGPVPTEWQEVAGYEDGRVGVGVPARSRPSRSCASRSPHSTGAAAR